MLALKRIFSTRALRGVRFDLLRFSVRLRNHRRVFTPPFPKLHLGCGERRLPGWLNIDISGSDYDVDLAAGSLPFPAASFASIVSQQVIEHLELSEQLIPLLRELRRICRPDGEVWLACPDIRKIAEAYLADGGHKLVESRRERWPGFELGGLPSSHIVNVLFHQAGEHVNLFDFELLKHLILEAGFASCEQRSEGELLKRFPEFPRRNDDEVSLYVEARIS